MKKIVILTALLSTFSANASPIDSCASYKNSERFEYVPIAQCKQILSGNEGGQYTTLVDADICIVRVRKGLIKKSYVLATGRYVGKMDSNSKLFSGIFVDSKKIKNDESQIYMVGTRSDAKYQIDSSVLHIRNAADNVDAIIQCENLK